MKSVLYSSLFLLMVFACSGPEKNTGKELITVSILPQAYFVEKLAGDLVEVNVMVPKGASPATYDPGMAQLAGLEKSIRYIQVGELGFEIGWMDRIRKINPEMKVLNLSLEIDLIETHADSEHEHHGHEELHAHQHGRSDPHIWMSVVNAYPIANIIHRELLEIFPDKRRELESNFQLHVHP